MQLFQNCFIFHFEAQHTLGLRETMLYHTEQTYHLFSFLPPLLIYRTLEALDKFQFHVKKSQAIFYKFQCISSNNSIKLEEFNLFFCDC